MGAAGEDLGDFYKDRNGKLWRWDYRDRLALLHDIRAVTDAYGGAESRWYTPDDATLVSDRKETATAWIDTYADPEFAELAAAALSSGRA